MDALETLRNSADPAGRIDGSCVSALFPDATFLKEISVHANFKIQGNTALAGKFNADTSSTYVSDESGLLLWFPSRGVNSFQRYGIVPAGLQSWEYAGIITPNTSYQFFLLSDGGLVLTFNSPLALPYNSSLNVDDVVQPVDNLVDELSTSRLVSGIVTVKSQTAAVGETSIGGVFSYGAVSDTRNVGQITTAVPGSILQGTPTLGINNHGSNPLLEYLVPPPTDIRNHAYSSEDIVNYSITDKDGVRNINVKDGMASLLASDVASVLAAPDVYQALQDNGAGWTKWVVFGPSGSFPPVPGAPPEFDTPVFGDTTCNGGIQFFVIYSAFITPWDILAAGQSNVYIASVPNDCGAPMANTLYYGPIAEEGWLDTQCILEFVPQDTGGVNDCTTLTIQIEGVHLFGSIDSNGNVCYYTGQFNNLINQPLGSVAGLPQLISFPIQSPKFWMQSNTNVGKFLGTSYNLYVLNLNPPVMDVPPAYNPVVFHPLGLTFMAREVSTYRPGEMGPARILRWDSLQPGMIVEVDGRFNAMTTASQLVAPQIKANIQMQMLSFDPAMLGFLSALWNFGPLKRNWTIKEYNRFLEEYVRSGSILDRKWIQQLCSSPLTPKVLKKAIQAVGLYTTDAATPDNTSQETPVAILSRFFVADPDRRATRDARNVGDMTKRMRETDDMMANMEQVDKPNPAVLQGLRRSY